MTIKWQSDVIPLEDTRCRIRQGWKDAGNEGWILAHLAHAALGQRWALVIWDSEDDPDCFKARGLEVKRLGQEEWESI